MLERRCEECGKIFYANPCEKGRFCSQECYGRWKSQRKEEVERICQKCGKKFLVHAAWVRKGGGKFCSRKCQAKSRRVKRIQRHCKQCGKVLWVTQKEILAGRGKFCSLECHGAWASQNRSGEKDPKWKGGKVKRICRTCGKEFETYMHYVGKGGGKYCSQKCYKESRGKRIRRMCKECGKIFYCYRSQIERGGGLCCSLSCARRSRKGFPMHHTKPELIFEQICEKYNLHFKYVGDGSLWIGKKGETQLNPDFIQADGEKIIVEVLGDYWHSPLLNNKIPERGTLAFRKKHYKKFKWTSFFIWESDLLRGDTEEFVLNLLGDAIEKSRK